MTRHCPQCRHDNQEWAQFCAQCGVELVANAAPSAAPPIAHQTSTPAEPAPTTSKAPGMLMLLVGILIAGAGWFVVFNSTGRPHRDLTHATDGHDHHLNPPGISYPTQEIELLNLPFDDDDLADAMFRLLSPSHVPIVVSRIDDERLHVQGTADQIASLRRFLDQLNSDHYSFRKKLLSYNLPSDQADALEDALKCAKRKVTVRRDGSTLHVKATTGLHDALGDLMQYVRPAMQSMVDVSNRHGY